MSCRAVPDVRACLGSRMRALRKTRRLSQESLGERAGLSGKFVGEVERGEKSISVDSLARVAEALGVGLEELLQSPAVRNPDAQRIYALVLATPRSRLRNAYAVLRAALS